MPTRSCSVDAGGRSGSDQTSISNAASIERAVPRQGISALATPEMNASHRPMASIVLVETFRPYEAPQIRKSLSLPTSVSVLRHDDRVRPRYLSFTTRAFIKGSISEPNPAATMRVARSCFSRLTKINQQSILGRPIGVHRPRSTRACPTMKLRLNPTFLFSGKGIFLKSPNMWVSRPSSDVGVQTF